LIDIHFSLEVVGVPGKPRLQDDSTVRLVYVRGTARIIVSKVEKIRGVQANNELEKRRDEDPKPSVIERRVISREGFGATC
jgi:hypothetical protein